MSEQTYAPPAGAPYTDARAGFWIRFGASFIDGLLLGVISIVLDLALKGPGTALSLIVGIAYYTYFEGGEDGQTLGKRACGISVRSVDGGSIGHTRAFLRYIGRIVSTIPIFLGYFWMLWDPNKQTWHDKIANSIVVPV
ncbi:MAG: hypothetical protein JWQ18_711 [Conexibacter sp.]|nr:hypothetical protein [Conexibacter sp.]